MNKPDTSSMYYDWWKYSSAYERAHCSLCSYKQEYVHANESMVVHTSDWIYGDMSPQMEVL